MVRSHHIFDYLYSAHRLFQVMSNPPLKKKKHVSGSRGAKVQVCLVRYSRSIVLKVQPTCEVQSERDEAVIASQELQRFLSLHQSPKVICYCFTIEEVVDANQEVPEATKEIHFIDFTFWFYLFSIDISVH